MHQRAHSLAVPSHQALSFLGRGHQRSTSMQALTDLAARSPVDLNNSCFCRGRCTLKVAILLLWLAAVVGYIGLGHMIRPKSHSSPPDYRTDETTLEALHTIELPRVQDMLEPYSAELFQKYGNVSIKKLETEVQLEEIWYPKGSRDQEPGKLLGPDRGEARVMLVTALQRGNQLKSLSRLLLTAKQHHPSFNLTLYLLTSHLSDQELTQLTFMVKPFSGKIVQFQYKLFPHHVKNLDLRAYKPLIIQDALYMHEAVVWADPEIQFSATSTQHLFELARKYGIAGQMRQNPTSQVTHFGMFRYFNVSEKAYYFHHMVDTRFLVLWRTPGLGRSLVQPWAQCALTLRCILPVGAATRGCDYNKTPKFRYSNCHALESAALNVLLGKKFNGDTPYLDHEEVVLLSDSHKQGENPKS